MTIMRVRISDLGVAPQIVGTLDLAARLAELGRLDAFLTSEGLRFLQTVMPVYVTKRPIKNQSRTSYRVVAGSVSYCVQKRLLSTDQDEVIVIVVGEDKAAELLDDKGMILSQFILMASFLGQTAQILAILTKESPISDLSKVSQFTSKKKLFNALEASERALDMARATRKSLEQIDFFQGSGGGGNAD